MECTDIGQREVHRVRFLESKSPNSMMTRKRWYYTSLNGDAFLFPLKSGVMVHDHSQPEKYRESDHLRLSTPKAESPHSSVSSLLSFERGRPSLLKIKMVCQGISSIILPEELRSREAGGGSKSII